ncbi:MAG: sigma-70 family RNA polymerase sigma factor [Phycisphaerales bacterium]|nr:sigma-70 family RNA polymerase sigma factor [Phycisphaerales bacterium]MCI0629757.1 sigma-70 family RNA polymerase sigma factor [Phycisphaerales bacterium]MCI0676492.1 sigma-70 family RNA polymerase sigma factor [Phycisphaerales bacterium]
MASEEDDLERRAIAGDRRDLAALLERHGPDVRTKLHGAIPRRWQSVLSADDVLQETFTEAFLSIGRFEPRGDGSFSAWLSALARHVLLDAVRLLETQRRGGDRRRVEPRQGDNAILQLCDQISATTSTPSRKVAGREAIESLKRAVEQLPGTYRQVVEMYDLQNRPIEEVATAIKRSPGAAYMQRQRAHRLLAQIMGSASRFFS